MRMRLVVYLILKMLYIKWKYFEVLGVWIFIIFGNNRIFFNILGYILYKKYWKKILKN